MPIRTHTSLHRSKKRRTRTESPSPSLSATSSFSTLEEQNYTRLYNDITNPQEITKCRHPLETGLKRADITNPSNERFNRNILKKICINDTEFKNLCDHSPSKYKNLQLTPIQKAMTYCMIHDGGSTTDEALCAFLNRFWKIISSYNNSDEPGSTGQKYQKPPDKRILHINYARLRDGLPLFVRYGDVKYGANTIDGKSSRDSISRNDSSNRSKKGLEKTKITEISSRRGRSKITPSNSSPIGITTSNNEQNKNDINNSKNNGSNNKNENKRKSINADLTKKSSSKEDSKFRKSGNGEDAQNETQNRRNGNDNENNNTKGNLNNSNSDLENSIAQNQPLRRTNFIDDFTNKHSRVASNFGDSNSFLPLTSQKKSRSIRGIMPKTLNLLTDKNIPEGENFQSLVLSTIKTKCTEVTDYSNGMTLNEISQACSKFQNVPGAYFELPLDRRIKSVLLMKKLLKEICYDEDTGKWYPPDTRHASMKRETVKKIQKMLAEKEDQSKGNNSESDNDENESKDEDIINGNIYMPEKLKLLKMSDFSVTDLWYISKDIGLIK